METREVPVIDLSRNDPQGRMEATRALGDTCRALGFARIRNIGLNPRVMDLMREHVQTLFALPLDTKLAYRDRAPLGQRGYFPVGREPGRDGAIPDVREDFQVGRDPPVEYAGHPAYERNIWPEDPLFRH